MLLANTPAQAESQLLRMEQAAKGIGLYMKSNKTKYMCFNLNVAFSLLNGKPLKLVNYLIYLGINVTSTEINDSICIGKVYTAIYKLSIIWKSDLFDKNKTEILSSYEMLEEKQDGNNARKMHAILNKFWKQHPTKQ